MTVTVALVVKPLAVPVTVTVKVLGVEEVQDKVDAPLLAVLFSVTLLGVKVQLRPIDGEMLVARLTVPVNPLRLVTVIPEVPVPPEAKLRVVGLAVTVKSWTV